MTTTSTTTETEQALTTFIESEAFNLTGFKAHAQIANALRNTVDLEVAQPIISRGFNLHNDGWRPSDAIRKAILEARDRLARES